MSTFLQVDEAQLVEIDRRLQLGLGAFAVPEPQTLNQWAQRNFYLSAESSYVEQEWIPWPFQRAILAVFSNDDVQEVDLKKSARVGYTKMLLAAIGYNAEHRRLNQALWQPTDGDAEDFAKTEVDTMLRDVTAMRRVFPSYLQRHKDNTLTQKRFIGSVLRILGGKSPGNYRRFGVDRGYMDELSLFDRDIGGGKSEGRKSENRKGNGGEGDPRSLVKKRLEGATFPKLICGSTPKLRGFCLISDAYDSADERFTFQIPCPQCGERHALTWGGKDEAHGMKWIDNDPSSVYHLCPHCTYPLTQSEYLAVAEQGVWINETATMWLLDDGTFSTPDGVPVDAPLHIGLHVWTAYSPVVAWASIIKDFLDAYRKQQEGDDAAMKTFVNTTRGWTWEGEIEKSDPDELKNRGEPFALRVMPRDCLLLLCGMDTQDNRIEASVWGYGAGGQMWTIDHKVFFGNPELPDLWNEVEAFLRDTQYPHPSGLPQRIYASAIDSGGHHANAVYAFAHRLRHLRVHAIKGASGRERSIDNGNARVDYTWQGKLEKRGPTLWQVGTNLAKDRFQSRLSVTAPGPGFVHLSSDLSDEWFKQLAGEDRASTRTATGTESRWTPNRKRIEVRDCLTYTIWLEERLDLWHPRKAQWWKQLEATLQPADDLFAMAAANDSRETQHPAPRPATPVVDSRETQPVTSPANTARPGFRRNW